ncbi:LuxR C-terminal-related transcriptional regulator [Saccharopolyspora sp. ASAGF58]|uniref:ATP-binding protein n=1 Tax=Saccharopolyspora sp. ASAGF58 TaxID=2719023 RepID=UPI00143FD5D8|nr:LuxR C-terminal-related transcriptional regulator [Saccharopolyspora sp. ASAGF58]QIZ38793.1 LuxR family transcriptional regulator [Saccharopolyspora sp. ASAGF58]
MRTIPRPHAGYLPAERTTFVDRRQASAEVKRLLPASRLVTLTGPGGVGKTRLAVHVARELQRAFPGGVWLVELAKVQDPGMLVHAVATTLHLPDQSARYPLTALLKFLAEERLLIVLDNCEHLVTAAAQMVNAVLPAAPGVRVLATSREPLNVPGEQVFPVPPLGVPQLDTSGGGVGQYEAVTLFAERGAAALPGFRVDRENEPAVARLCQRLDGLPLAIELAARRLRGLSVEQILQRLENRFQLLTAGPRGGLPRHQTLQAAIEWSFDLCSPTEQTLWARLSVFAGEFDLEAAEQVCAGSDVAEGDVLDTIFGLVDKSILSRAENDTTTRYRMLETIRQYGRQRLAAQGAETMLRRRHRDYYLALAEQADAQWLGVRQRQWWQRFQGQGPNLWAALDFCCTQPGEARAGLRLASVLWFYWVACGFVRDGRYWLDRVLALPYGASRERARALWVDGWIGLVQGDLPRIERSLGECLDVADRVGDRAAIAHATQFLGFHAVLCDDIARAAELEEQALAMHRALGELRQPALRTFVYGAIAYLELGDLDRAMALGEEGRSISERAGDELAQGWMHWVLAAVRRIAGDVAAAEEEARAALRLTHSFHDVLYVTLCLMLLALVAMDRGDAERSARLFGVLEQLWKLMGAIPLLGNAEFLVRWQSDCERRARKALGDRAYEAAYQQGKQLDVDQAVAYALREQAPLPPPGKVPAAGGSVLTRREREVAELVAQGLSNKDIASRLVISQRTAETHVEHILIKLGATSRTQIAAWAVGSKHNEGHSSTP